jgi:hypothetical protein
LLSSKLPQPVLDASRREALLPPPVAIRTKVVYYLLHGPYDLLSLLFDASRAQVTRV